MNLHVEPLEALWMIVNTVTLILTIIALIDARHDLGVARADQTERHDARELAAEGNVRRELLRTVVQLLLLSVVAPGLFIDRSILLSPPVVALIMIPIVLLTSSVFDARDRVRLADMLMGSIVGERAALALEASVQQNIELTREVGIQAEAAYHEANSVNEKIATLTEIVGGKEPRHDDDEPTS